MGSNFGRLSYENNDFSVPVDLDALHRKASAHRGLESLGNVALPECLCAARHWNRNRLKMESKSFMPQYSSRD